MIPHFVSRASSIDTLYHCAVQYDKVLHMGMRTLVLQDLVSRNSNQLSVETRVGMGELTGSPNVMLSNLCPWGPGDWFDQTKIYREQQRAVQIPFQLKIYLFLPWV